MNTVKTCALTLVMLGLCAVNVFGFGSGSGQSRGGKGGPPPEAYTACEDKQAGDEASFKSPRGDTVEGICEKHGDKLVLRPTNPPKNRPN